ncbi:hypothetical protein [Streptomyces sp. MUM 136J]|nr:hypothetical protein [Streptomyces sp. MUM 136J]
MTARSYRVAIVVWRTSGTVSSSEFSRVMNSEPSDCCLAAGP